MTVMSVARKMLHYKHVHIYVLLYLCMYIHVNAIYVPGVEFTVVRCKLLRTKKP